VCKRRDLDELARRQSERRQSELLSVDGLAASAQMTVDPVLCIKYQLSLSLKGSHGHGANAKVLDGAKAWPGVQAVNHADAYCDAITWCSQHPPIASKQWSISSIKVTADYSRCAARDTFVSSIAILNPAEDW
jgi:hypothetical protein